MAAAFLSHLSAGAVEVRSAGSAPADQVNPAAVQAMAEVGISIAAEKPKILTDQAVRESDVVITMGCGDTCPFYPGKRYEDWVLNDPAGKDVAAVGPFATKSDAASRRCSTTSFRQASDRVSETERQSIRRGCSRCRARACNRPTSPAVHDSGCRPPPAA